MAHLAGFIVLFLVAAAVARRFMIALALPVKPGERRWAMMAWIAGGEQRARLRTIVAMRRDRELEEEARLETWRDRAARRSAAPVPSSAAMLREHRLRMAGISPAGSPEALLRAHLERHLGQIAAVLSVPPASLRVEFPAGAYPDGVDISVTPKPAGGLSAEQLDRLFEGL